MIAKDSINRNYEIGGAPFAIECNDLLQSFALGAIFTLKPFLSNDVLFYFPDNEQGRRKYLKGSSAVINYWNRWRKMHLVSFIGFTDINSIAVDINKSMQSGFTPGSWVFSWQTVTIQYPNQRKTACLNINFHFDDDNKIDQCLTYFDVKSLHSK